MESETKHNIIKIHSAEDFINMRKAGGLAAHILDYITEYVQPGVTTEKLNSLCHDEIIRYNAIPAPLNYKGFPKSICTSVNHVICHGIPNNQQILRQGDIINIDVTVIVDGWHGDASRMYLVGKKIPRNAEKLCQVTYEAMMKSIEIVRPGAKFSDIGNIIQQHANYYGYSVVKDFCGHGIGRNFHDDLQILHYKNNGSSYPNNDIMEEGMFFTIEPMINEGVWQAKIMPDRWTAITKDRKLSAQWEHTLAVTANGYEIFTLSQNFNAADF